MTACPSCDSDISDLKIRFCGQCGHDLSKRSTHDDFDGLIGQTVEGRYRVVERIGTGGMGVVYRVEHVRMGKIAAMKVLRRDLADDHQAAKRFRREVEAVSKLDHPNIIQTFDFGEWRGLLYLVMEFIKGDDLAAIVKREGRMAPSRAIPLFVQVCAALDEAHHLGIIHRDLKPDNIVCLQRRGQGETVKVLDFGLAKLRERPGLAEVTGAGSLIGTPYYMAPEQVRSEAVDQRTDIYSLGATLYRVLTGTPPFQADSPMAILTRHLNDEVEPPSLRVPDAGIDIAIDHVVLKAMAKLPANRYATADAMGTALAAALQGVVLDGDGAGGVKGGTRSGFHSLAGVKSASPSVSSMATLPDVPNWIDNPVTASSDGDMAGPGTGDDRATTMADDRAPGDDSGHSDSVVRLRREDVDLFERQMVRRKRTLLSAAPVALVVAAALAWMIAKRSTPHAGPTETEPNDSVETADLLANEKPVFGQIGEPGAAGAPDVDYFRVPAGSGKRVVTAAATGIPDLDILIEVFNSAGEMVGKADRGKLGAAEAVASAEVGPLDAYVRIRALWIEGAVIKGSSTPYTLTVSWAKPGPDPGR